MRRSEPTYTAADVRAAAARLRRGLSSYACHALADVLGASCGDAFELLHPRLRAAGIPVDGSWLNEVEDWHERSALKALWMDALANRMEYENADA